MPDRYYLWGAGNVGRRALMHLAPLGVLDGIIDVDQNKHGQTICGLEISGYDSVKPHLKSSGVIIAHFDSKATQEVLDRDGVSYCRLSEFVTEWYWANKRQNAIGFLDFIITTRCSLQCVACMQYISFRDNADIPIDSLKQGLTSLFSHISFLGEMSMIGGEPFLYKHLPELLEFIAINYCNHIGSLVITTNGTVIPEKNVIDLCRKLKVFVSISDYSNTLPWVNKSIVKLETALRDAGLGMERKRWNWINPGRFELLPNYMRGNCTQTHMQLFDSKLWRCTLMAAGHAAGLCTADANRDYCDLGRVNDRKIQKLIYGLNLPERTSQCHKCLYQKALPISAAVQK